MVPSVVEVISPLVLSVVEVIFLPTFVAAVVVVFLHALYETTRKIVVFLPILYETARKIVVFLPTLYGTARKIVAVVVVIVVVVECVPLPSVGIHFECSLVEVLSPKNPPY